MEIVGQKILGVVGRGRERGTKELREWRLPAIRLPSAGKERCSGEKEDLSA